MSGVAILLTGTSDCPSLRVQDPFTEGLVPPGEGSGASVLGFSKYAGTSEYTPSTLDHLVVLRCSLPGFRLLSEIPAVPSKWWV